MPPHGLTKQGGKGWPDSAIGCMNPRFDLNDMVDQSRSDLINGHVGVGYQWTDANRWRKYANTIVSLFQLGRFKVSGPPRVRRLLVVGGS